MQPNTFMVLPLSQKIVLPPKFFCPNMIVWVKMFIDLVDVENIARQSSVPKKHCINKFNKHLILDNHLGIENSRG